MALNREAIMNALLDRIRASLPELRTCTRRDTDWDSIHKPGAILSTEIQERDDLGRWLIQARINVLVNTIPNDQSPETKLNLYVDQIDDALEAQVGESPAGGFRTTLGGLCASARIAGRIELRQGVGGVGEAIVPVEIIAYEAD